MQVDALYVLGFDLGTSSVGWALVRIPEDETQAELVRLGVRKFNEVYTKGDTPDKKNTTSNAERRNARLMRRQTKRKRNRKHTTLAILRNAGLANDGIEPFPGMPLCRFSPYDIWARAYDTDLRPYEFGRLLYVLAHRRGFKSNLGAGLGNLKDRPQIANYLKSEEEDERNTALAAEAKARERASKGSKEAKADDGDDDGKTLVQVGRWHGAFSDVPLGKFFFALLNPGLDQRALADLAHDPEASAKLANNSSRQQVRNKAGNPLWARPDRAAYEMEFFRLWGRQALHLGLTNEIRDALFQALFFQNPLKFPADNRAFCPYGRVTDQETGETKAAHRSPKCNLLFQEYRIWKLLGDMYVKEGASGEQRHLTLEEKLVAFDKLNQQKEVSWSELGKSIGKPKAIFEPSERKQQGHDYTKAGMVGNPIAGWFRARKENEPAGDDLLKLWEMPERFLKSDLKQEWKGTDKGKREAVRHHLVRIIGEAPFARTDRFGTSYPEASAERIVVILQTDFEISDLCAYRLATAPFPDGYASLSYIAMSRIISHMRDGRMEWESIRDEFGDQNTESNSKPLGYIPAPPSALEILSPRVRKALNQARHIIGALRNEVPDLEIDEIRVEMARRMQMGNDDYRSLLIYQAYNLKMNDQARRFWSECRPNVQMPRTFPEKYRLWREQGMMCPYTLMGERTISTSNLLDGTAVEIEHIWPRQQGGDSYGNKVIVFREANQRKGGSAPWQLSEDWRQAVAKNMLDWPIFGKKTDDTSSKQTAKEDRVAAPPKAVDIARSKVNRVKTSKVPAAKDDGFADRQGVETGYIATEAIKYLKPAARSVIAVKSTFSTSLAKNWGFYKRLNTLHEDDIGKIPMGKKDRVLNRHHAVDALAVALCSLKVIKRIVSLEKELMELRDPKHALKSLDPNSQLPTEDAEIRAKWLHKQLARLQPPSIANGLTGALAQVVVSHESRQRPRGKFFAEQPFGVSKKRVMIGDEPKFLNRRIKVSTLKATQVFPGLGRAKDKQESGETDGATRGAISSALSRQRIADYCEAKGFSADRGGPAIDDFLKGCTDGISYENGKGERWLRKVQVRVPCDVLGNYRVVDRDGGQTLYPKLERHCAVIVPNGKKTIMEVVPLVDAATARDVDPDDYDRVIVALAAARSGRSLAAFVGASVLHKGDMIRIRRHDTNDWESDIYKIEVINGSGRRLWIRAHWSADRETLKGQAIGSIIASSSVFEFLKLRVSASGQVENYP